MTVTIEKGTASGRVYAPPSKSMTHRDLICGAFSGGSTIGRVERSEDVAATLDCLAALGASVSGAEKAVTIGGLDPRRSVFSPRLFCRESGSTLRFLLPVCLLFNQEITLTGSKRLFERPLGVYADICRSQGISFRAAPQSVTVCGRLQSGKYEVRGDLSSQFISGLLFALPLLEKESVLDITGALESASYIKLTLKALGDFGVRVTRIDETTFRIPGGQHYKKRDLTVEGDYSGAAFFEALNLFGGNVMVEGLAPRSFQGDRVYRKLFGKLGRRETAIELSDCPDLAPVLFAAAAATGGAVFTGTHRLKLKESDRAEAMRAELAKFGVPVTVGENTVTVGRAALKRPDEVLDGHGDHRIVMALSVLCTLTGGSVSGAEAVAKSFPDFFAKLNAVGIKVEKQ